MPHVLPADTRRGVAVDLFSGWGGLSYGFEMGGFDIALGVDVEPAHCAAHEFNFPTSQALARDAATLSGDDLRPSSRRTEEIDALVMGRLPESPDLLLAGPPCVGFSTIGKRDPSDPRNRLVSEFVRLLGEAQPRFAVMENVPGMLSGPYKGLLDTVCEAIEARGYSVVSPIRTLDARDYGVPQNRERVFLLAYRRGEIAPAYPEPTHSRTPSLLLPSTPTAWEALADLPAADLFPELLTADEVDASGHWGNPQHRYAMAMRGTWQSPDDLSYPRTWNPSLLTCSKRTAHSAETVARYTALRPGEREPKHRLTRIDGDGACLTLRAGTPAGERGGHTAARPIHPTKPRVITVREGCRLHGIPDWIRIGRGPWDGFRLLGNSVPPPLGWAISREIAKAARLAPSQPTLALPPGDESLLRASGQELRRRFAAPPADKANSRVA